MISQKVQIFDEGCYWLVGCWTGGAKVWLQVWDVLEILISFVCNQVTIFKLQIIWDCLGALQTTKNNKYLFQLALCAFHWRVFQLHVFRLHVFRSPTFWSLCILVSQITASFASYSFSCLSLVQMHIHMSYLRWLLQPARLNCLSAVLNSQWPMLTGVKALQKLGWTEGNKYTNTHDSGSVCLFLNNKQALVPQRIDYNEQSCCKMYGIFPVFMVVFWYLDITIDVIMKQNQAWKPQWPKLMNNWPDFFSVSWLCLALQTHSRSHLPTQWLNLIQNVSGGYSVHACVNNPSQTEKHQNTKPMQNAYDSQNTLACANVLHFITKCNDLKVPTSMKLLLYFVNFC